MNNKFTIKTLGCKTNQIESALIEERLIDKGFILVQDIPSADYFVLNSCSVTSTADNKAISILKHAKKENPLIKTVLTGCFAQLEHEKLKKNEFVDYLVGNQEKADIPMILLSDKKYAVTDIFDYDKFRYEKLNDINKTRATIKIQDGCNNRCSYCTIPFARGKNRSNPIKNVLEQIDLLNKHGFEEIVLTGIHIGQWGNDFSPAMNLIDLLKAIETTNITRYRLGSLNPIELNDELLNFLASSNKFCPHFHISLQSACDKTLSNMNRRYSYDLAFDIMEKINKKFNLPFIGSDVIVGFPDETDEDFEITYNNLKRTKLSKIHVFPYSRRKNTVAARMKNQIQDSVKKIRVKNLLELADEKLLTFLNQNIGLKTQILVEPKRDKKTGFLKGVTPNYLNVLVDSKVDVEGLKIVEIVGVAEDNERLIGSFID